MVPIMVPIMVPMPCETMRNLRFTQPFFLPYDIFPAAIFPCRSR